MNTVHETLTCTQDFVVGNHDDPDKPDRMEIAVEPAPPIKSVILSTEALRDLTRRTYAAGCEAIEFHEEDYREEVEAILDDVVQTPGPDLVLVPMSVLLEKENDQFWEREERIDRLRDLLAAAAKAVPDQEDTISIKEREIRIDLGGPGPLCVPVRALEGIDLRMVPAIVASYVEAFKAGRRAS